MRSGVYLILLFFPLFCFPQMPSEKAGTEDSLIAVLKKAGADTLRVNALHELSNFYRLTNPKKAFELAQEQRTLAEKLNYKKGIASSLRSYANWFFSSGQPDSAIYYDLISCRMFHELKMNRAEILGYLNIARAYYRLGKRKEAGERYFEMLRLSEKLHDTFCIRQTCNALGTFYFRMHDGAKARMYYEKQLTMTEPQSPEERFALTSIGSSWLEEKNFDKALYYYNKVLKSAIEKNDKNALALIYENIAVIKAQQPGSDKNEVLKYYKAALALYEELQRTNEVESGNLNLGSYYAQLKMYNDAALYAEKTLTLSTASKHLENQMYAYELLGTISTATGNFKKAYDYQVRYSSIKDTLLDKEKTNQIAELETKYQTEKKQLEIINLQKDNQAKELKIAKSNNQIILLSSGIAVVLLIGGIVFIFMRNRHKQALHAEAIKHREMQLKGILNAQEEERKRIAKDLHDGVGQLLAGLKISLQHISGKQNLQEEMIQPSKVLDEAAREVRFISHQMMPRVLEESGLVPAIEDMLNNTFRNSSIQYEFEHSSVSERYNHDIEINLFRVVQEITNNIIKHSEATQVSFQLFKNGKTLLLIAEDNGKGFGEDADKKTGHGLMNIQGRIKSVNGDVSFEPGPEKGTVITIRIPVE